jgi:opacity protein-like surface antigen
MVQWVAGIAILAAPVAAWGQTSSGAQWQRGTTLGGFAGAAAVDGATPALGTALGWEFHRHVSVEGRGIWMTTDPGSDFYVALNALVPLRSLRNVVPFATAGIGMYRATVDVRDGDVPDFYQQRMNGRPSAAFQDVALPFGGGANVFVTSHVAIRPEASVILVVNGSETRTVGLYGIHVAYHFEPHKTR